MLLSIALGILQMTIYYRPCRDHQESRFSFFSLYHSDLIYKYPLALDLNCGTMLLAVVLFNGLHSTN